MSIHVVQLLFDAPPTVDATRMLEKIRVRRPKVELVPGQSAAATMFAHPDHPATFEGGKQVPPLTTVTVAGELSKNDRMVSTFQTSLRETWECPAVVPGCTLSLSPRQMGCEASPWGEAVGG